MYSDYNNYKGALCSSWLQEELITIDTKGPVSLPRRYSFRYVRIKILSAPHSVVLNNFSVEAVSSADFSALKPLSTKIDKTLKKIDEISIHTLAECMQDFFEDGPKRDRRLWLGDFRLQALANYYTFNNLDIVRRCLYLFASFDKVDKLLPSYLYTRPEIDTGDAYLVSYSLLFTVSLCDYYEHTKDNTIVEELFETAKRQIIITEKMLDDNLVLSMPENYGWWAFVDWSDIEPAVSLTGIFMYTLEKFATLCNELNKKYDAEYFTNLLKNIRISAKKYLYNHQENIFVSSYDKNQYSVGANVWMILGGVTSKNESQQILSKIINNDNFLQPVTPYMHHYVVEAMLKSDMITEATEYIKNYWGLMADYGADTFWEVFVSNDHFASPYGDSIINSSCHAWSCTPTYFIRKYNLK